MANRFDKRKLPGMRRPVAVVSVHEQPAMLQKHGKHGAVVTFWPSGKVTTSKRGKK